MNRVRPALLAIDKERIDSGLPDVSFQTTVQEQVAAFHIRRILIRNNQEIQVLALSFPGYGPEKNYRKRVQIPDNRLRCFLGFIEGDHIKKF